MSTAAGNPLEKALMTRIKQQWGAAIDTAVNGTPYPASLLAALTANESGGDAGATRYEPAEFGRFALVLAGQKPSHQGIVAVQLLAKMGSSSVKAAVTVLVIYCTSWGLTQIMGYHALKGGYALADLATPAAHFCHAVELLDEFGQEFNLLGPPAQTNWANFFRCWNTGRPNGKTFDPDYVPNGLARMQMYEALP